MQYSKNCKNTVMTKNKKMEIKTLFFNRKYFSFINFNFNFICNNYNKRMDMRIFYLLFLFIISYTFE